VTALALSVAPSTRYRPIAAIGRGGMAEVLLTLMDAGGGVNKIVVLKRVWPDLATDNAFVAMFRDEARLSIRLNHPNVVDTYEVVEEDDRLALSMEYLHGQTLTALFNRLGGPRELSLQLRLRILVEILAGLHYAHDLTDYGGNALGVVHRDVSPNNVFVTYDGQVKLMDFGVAKTEAAGQRTRPGGIAGKLAYLAPEYLRNDYAVDRRADVFTVGVMLWEMLSGRRLWNGKADAEIVHHLAAGQRMPDLPVDPNRPPVLSGICARALAVNPDERYATAGELEIDLRNVMVGAADSHARTLGRVVSNAFATARTEREQMIARALVTGKAMVARPDWVRDPTWAVAIDAFLSRADDVLDVTVVDEASVVEEALLLRPAPATVPPLPPPPPPPAARRRSRVNIGGAVAGTAAAAAILGLIVATSTQSASRPSPPAPPAATAETHADITPLPAGQACTFVASAPAPGAAPPAAPVPLEPAMTGAEASTLPASAATKNHFARRAAAARREVQRDTDATMEASPFDEAIVEKKRPAAAREIDENDPFK